MQYICMCVVKISRVFSLPFFLCCRGVVSVSHAESCRQLLGSSSWFLYGLKTSAHLLAIMWKQIREMCKCVCVFSAQHYGSMSHTELCSNSVLFIKKVCLCEHWQLLRSTEIMVLFCCSLNRNTPQVTDLSQSPLGFITCGLGEGI